MRSVSARAAGALHEYVSSETRSKFAPQFETVAIDKMLHSPEKGLRILWFRALVSFATTPIALNELKDLLDGKAAVPEVDLRPLDRWRMVAALLAQSAPGANEIYEGEKKRDPTGIGPKYAYITAAANPDAATKKWYFDDYMNNPARQEDWVQDSLGYFNEWNQSELTAPYLKTALEALPQIKQQRKIFFLMAWLNAFIGGQQSAAADEQVHTWLATANIDHDLQLKILQVVDELDRAVKIHQRFNDTP